MIKLVCKKCDHVWYTSNTSSNQRCDECGARLIEVELINAVENKNTSTVEFSGNNVAV